LFLSILVLTSTAFAGFVSVTTTDAFVYSQPDENSEAVIGAPQYYPLYVFAKAKGWYQVKDWMGSKGWIHSSLVETDRTFIVKKFKVVFRTGPGRKYASAGTLYKGYVLKYLGQTKNYYYKVQLVDPPEDTVGWVHSSMVW